MYNIIRPDGVKVGPLDMITLLEWRNRGRLLPDTILEEIGTGTRLRAKTLANLFPPDASPEDLAPNAEPEEERVPVWDEPGASAPNQGQAAVLTLFAPFLLIARMLAPGKYPAAEASAELFERAGSGGRIEVLLLWGLLSWVVIAAAFGVYK